MTNAADLAASFASIIQSWTSPEELAKIKRLNATEYKDSDCCATQDVMDANEAMALAFETATGHAVDGDNEADCALWNTAWNIAKTAYLSEEGKPNDRV